jgi:hypothetical protein
MLAVKSVKFLVAYLSPTRPRIASDLSACLGGGLPVLMAGDLNAKHVELNSRLITKRGRSLLDYADRNSCLIQTARISGRLTGPNSCLETGMPPSPDLPNKGVIDACVKELTGAISKALADSTLKCRPRADPRPPLPAQIQDETRLKTRLSRQ